jgi:hypothetical protein
MISFDLYSRHAHLKPGLIAVLPITIALLAWMGTGSPVEKAFAALIATSGGTYALAMLARNKGRAIQEKLWKTWGGAPTIQLLRHFGPSNPVVRKRWHQSMEKLTGQKLPTAAQEAEDPMAEDIRYEAAIRALIVQRRDKKKFPLIFQENIHYGFCRNLLGLRPIGITCSFLGAVASGIAIIYAEPKLHVFAAICCCVNAIILLLWFFLINPDWVKEPAFAYAERLLESSEPPTISTIRKQ